MTVSSFTASHERETGFVWFQYSDLIIALLQGIEPLEWAGLIKYQREKSNLRFEIKEIKATELYHKFIQFTW
jgi:hypothetical protein